MIAPTFPTLSCGAISEGIDHATGADAASPQGEQRQEFWLAEMALVLVAWDPGSLSPQAPSAIVAVETYLRQLADFDLGSQIYVAKWTTGKDALQRLDFAFRHRSAEWVLAALVKSFGGAHYVFAQTARRGSEALTFTLSGDAGKTAKVVYDSNAHFDAPNSAEGTPLTLSGGGAFTDTFGAHGHDYQVKIYEVR